MRFPEGTLHGFLSIHNASGTLVGHGNLVQTVVGDSVKSRMVLEWNDGSSFDERVTFTQHDVFTMRRYQLAQRGPAFSEDMDVVLDRGSGRYEISSRGHGGGEKKQLSGTLEWRPDLYNGMIILITRNLPSQRPVTVHIAAFTPEPRIIELEIVRTAGPPVHLGKRPQETVHYILKPKLGVVVGALAALTGRTPPDGHVWNVVEPVPAFVRFEGTLSYEGAVQRIDLTSPVWPEAKR